MSKELVVLKLSTSSIKTYEKCPRNYHYRYNLKPKIKEKNWDHLALGNFVHDVLELFHNILQEEPNKDQVKLMGACCNEKEYEKKWGKLKFPMTADVKTEARKILKDYLVMLKVRGLPNVQANEKQFNVDLGNNIIIRGLVDREDLGLLALGTEKDPERVHIVDYKGLALDTQIPVPTGWTTMGELAEGEFVIGSNGKPTKILHKSKIHNRPCYKITMSDNTTVTCDNVHLWEVSKIQGDKDYTAVMNAEKMFSLFQEKGSFVVKNVTLSNDSLTNHNFPTEPYRVIAAIERANSVPTQCIEVEAEDSLFLCSKGYLLSHNSGKSKYLDEFQLLVYGIPVMEEKPDLQEYEASYLCLKENMKWITYSFTRTDVEKVKTKIRDVARSIREDITWEARPQFLCKFCDYVDICEAAHGSFKKVSTANGEVSW